MSEPIAIIGMGCRFPGGSNTPALFWKMLIEGVDAISDVPPNRFDIKHYHDPQPQTPGKVAARQGGFIDVIDRFDAGFFGISPREANFVDPQQRLLLEVGWEALEDAGQVPHELAGSRTGVYVGMWTNEYEDRMFAAVDDINLYVTTGGGRYSASGRLSYAFDFHGPSVTVDTACSSSLVALHFACQSIWNGETDMALVGASNLILVPHITIGYSRSGMLSPDGRCKFGDARANGYVRSEGVGALVLKPLAQAQADGDPIYALIRGSAVNNDGKSSELLVAPSPDTQAEMLRTAYQTAGVDAAKVRYIEAHGTGTRVGDPVELTALGRVLGENRPADRPCLVGSVKTNIGHAEAASGMAGLIKAVLCLKHRMIPPTLHFHDPNPGIPWAELPFVLPTSMTEWPDDEVAYAGVNSFGITGTNAHVVLQEAPRERQTEAEVIEHAVPLILPLSAKGADALRDMARMYQTLPAEYDLYDLCYTAARRRTHHPQRLAVVTGTAEEFAEQLGAFINGEKRRGLAVSGDETLAQRRIVFIFPGQGGQWVGMGRQLLQQEPVFRDMMERCEAAMRPYVDWSLMGELESGARLEAIDVVQPMLFAIQVSLAALWRAWGIEPDAVIGHSLGEVAGAYVAGALSLEDAAHVICRRSQLMKRVSGKGAMAVVELTFDEALEAIRGYEDRLGIAVSNGPRSTVLSGDPTALDAVLDTLRAQEIFCRPVKVDVAAHSPHMEALRPELVRDLQGLKAQDASVPVYSTVTGEEQAGAAFDADYWGRNLRQPVLFSTAVSKALTDGYNTFIEISPHPVLLAAVEQGIQGAQTEGALTLASMRRQEDERAVMLEALGGLYAAGHPIDWARLYPTGRTLRLPTYPWQRERFWVAEAPPGTRRSAARLNGQAGNLLLGSYFKSQTGTHFWETELDLKALPYLSDHRVQGRAVLPAAAYSEMALSAANEAFGAGAHSLENVSFVEAMFLPEEGSQTVQTILTPDMPGRALFHIFSHPADNDQAWTLHASGTIRLGEADLQPAFDTPETIRVHLPNSLPEGDFYQLQDNRRLSYGPTFRAAGAVWRSTYEALAQLRPHNSLRLSEYQVHPALLDAAFQTLLGTLADEDMHTYLPVTVAQLRLYRQPKPEAGLWAFARRLDDSGDVLTGDVLLLDNAGQVILTAEGLRMQRLERAGGELADWMYAVEWEAVQDIAQGTATGGGRWLVLADEGGFGHDLAARLESMGGQVVIAQAGEWYVMSDPGFYTVNPASVNDFEQLMHDIAGNGNGTEWRGIIHLWSLDASEDDIESAETAGPISAMHLIQAMAEAGITARLWLVTRGGQVVGEGERPNAAQAPLWGFGAVVQNEHADLRPTLVDLDGSDAGALASLVGTDMLLNALALREGNVYARRLKPFIALTIEKRYEQRMVSAAEQPFRAEVTTPGILEGLKLRAVERHAPKAGEVEIEVVATGLNFMNVMSALGVYPGYPNGVGPLGIECAGRIVAIGEGVTEWKVGDEVLAVAFDSLGTHAITDARLVRRKPGGMRFEEAATIPIVFLTAYYALYRLGHLEAGERVLIHAAAGGVGLAAVQLAQLAGAEVWATAGTPEKRDTLRGLGVEHILDSRSLAFADDILTETNGEGVDMILNSLAGEAIPRGLAILRPYGRFLEIGKRDIYNNSQVGLLPFQKNLSYYAIDLDRMTRERPAVIGAMLGEIMELVEQGDLRPLPVSVFPVGDVVTAFRHMAQAKHIGKVVVTMQHEAIPVEFEAAPLARGDGAYLITGGLGGLGLEVAKWLARQGAGHVVLTGRRAPSETAREAIGQIEATGTQVHVRQTDVSDPEAVAGVVAEIEHNIAPLRGVFHAAGVLEDGVVLQLDAERFRTATRPKIAGAWALHQATRDLALDHFVLFSSVAALLGIPGQANYAAGNAYLDALAHERRADGLPALSINWGPWSDVGLAAAQANRGDRLAQRGLGSITPEQGITALEQLMAVAPGEAAVMPFDAAQWAQTYPAARQSTLLGVLLSGRDEGQVAEAADGQGADVRAELLAVEPGRARRALLEAHIREQVARVLGLAAGRVDVQKPLRNMGIDSLMTLELRNRLEASLKLSLPATLVFNYPTVAALAGHLAEKLGVPLEAGKAEAVTADAAPTDELENLSRDEVEAMLAEELKSIDELLKGN